MSETLDPSERLPQATLIGDIVGSRDLLDRQSVHDALASTLADVNRRLKPTLPLRIVLGDEYQGAFATVGQAYRASMVIRLALAPEVDVRHGIGWGGITALDEETSDGPGWWAARQAIELVHADQSTPALAATRTSYASALADTHSPPSAVNAALCCQDQLLGDCDERSLRILARMLDGDTQATIAKAEGISASAVSQRVQKHGLGMILRSAELLMELP